MNLRKAVTLREKIQDATRVGHEVFIAERPGIGGNRMFVSEDKNRQTLVVGIECGNRSLTRARKRQTTNLQGGGL